MNRGFSTVPPFRMKQQHPGYGWLALAIIVAVIVAALLVSL